MPTLVALRKESVDRNGGLQAALSGGTLSLSARRAWIEINNVETAAKASLVALRKESVDRNSPLSLLPVLVWVALRKESVDRNKKTTTQDLDEERRSPQGERG